MSEVIVLPILLCPFCGDNLQTLEHARPPDFVVTAVCPREPLERQMFRVQLPRLGATVSPWTRGTQHPTGGRSMGEPRIISIVDRRAGREIEILVSDEDMKLPFDEFVKQTVMPAFLQLWAKIGPPCSHDEPNVGFDPVRREMICRCGARKDVHELNQPWIRPPGAVDVRGR